MTGAGTRLGRLPIESSRPIEVFAATRLGLTVLSAIAVAVLGFPFEGELELVLGAVALPWSVGMLVVSHRSPERALHPLVALADVAVLAVVLAAVPETYGPVHFTALFLLAVHAHFQGERIGVAVAAVAVAALATTSAVVDDPEVTGDQLVFYETVFGAAALACCALVGGFRTAESASRLRARGLTRRTIRAETEIRRRVAESIHDSAVQELIALDMMLGAARQATERGEAERAIELIGDAQLGAEKSVRSLRDEIVDLGPYAFEELTYAIAIERCKDVWRRRYGFEITLALESLELDSELAGDLFRVTQEAVVNAGRHAKASTVSISLRSVNGDVELRVSDDGQGFTDGDPLAATEPGHLGLASMRERAELAGGELRIDSSDKGTKIVLTAPLRRARLARRGRSGR